MEKRENIYDYIRVLSCFSIIFIHCANDYIGAQVENSIMWYLVKAIQTLAWIALPMFVFISGSLILNSKDESIMNFYKKRFLKIVIPFLLYSILYVIIFGDGIKALQPINFLKTIKNILNASVYFHLWFPYMIIGLYLCAPFLKIMCKNLSDKDVKALFWLLIIISFIQYFLPSFGINIGIKNIAFSEWIIVFLLGYLCTREVIREKYKFFYILGALSFIFSLAVTFLKFDIKELFSYSIIMLFQIIAIYLFFYRNKDKICKNMKINKIMEFISKYTFDTYIVHGGIFVYLCGKIKLAEFNNIFWLIIMVALVSAISFVFSFIIHNTLIKLSLFILEKICSGLKKIGEKNGKFNKEN